jgi:hypothetical protein
MRALAWFHLVIGASVIGVWTLLLATGQVPELTAGQVDIWFHLAAELLLAGLSLGAGVALLRRSHSGPLLSGLALGALLYSAVNSAGYYAEAGDAAMVAMFGVVALAGVAAGRWWYLRGAPPTLRTPDRPPARVG